MTQKNKMFKNKEFLKDESYNYLKKKKQKKPMLPRVLTDHFKRLVFIRFSINNRLTI